MNTYLWPSSRVAVAQGDAHGTHPNTNNVTLSGGHMEQSPSKSVRKYGLSHIFYFFCSGFTCGCDGQEVHGVRSRHAGRGRRRPLPRNVLQVRGTDGEKLQRLKQCI